MAKAKVKVKLTVIPEPSYSLEDVDCFLNDNLEHLERFDPSWDDGSWWEVAVEALAEYRDDYEYIKKVDEIPFLKSVGYEAKKRNYGVHWNDELYDEEAYA